MKKFWSINIVLATSMLIVFFSIVVVLFNEVENLAVDPVYFKIILLIISLAIIQFVIGLIYFVVKFKKHSFWAILILIYFLGIIFLEIGISFAVLGGFLGDM